MNFYFSVAKNIKTRFFLVGEKNDCPIVFLHGWGGEAKNFLPLAQKIFDVSKTPSILIDLPGFGESASPPKQGWSTTEYADFLFDFLRKEGITQCILYGHSFGGRIAVRFLLKYPGMVQKAVLTGSAGIKWPDTWKQKTLRVFKPLRIIAPPFLRKFVLKRLGASDWAEVSEGLRETLRKTLDEPDFRNELKKIEKPVLLLWGRFDTYSPLKSARVFESHLPNAKLWVFENGRHGIHLTHSDQIAQCVRDFLL